MYLDGFKTFMDEVPRTQPTEAKEEFEWFTGFDGLEPDPIKDPMRMPVNFTGELPTVMYSKEDMINNMVCEHETHMGVAPGVDSDVVVWERVM